MFYDQSTFDVRCEWGLGGVKYVGDAADVRIIVDVLSFSTCVEVAISRGATVIPYRWKDERALLYAAEIGAELAVPRGQTGRFSLSPRSILEAVAGDTIVLPSPNGSELTVEAAALGGVVVCGCFRNCCAVATYAAARGRAVTVVACGERWPDGTLRPAVEDLAGAGAIIANLPGTVSPEARVAVAAWETARNDLNAFLRSCASGRELLARGFDEDVEIAAQVDCGAGVPVLRGGAYVR